MIDGERQGPFELEQLADVGVRPDTYVWCKGMPDWQPAEEVADICRFWRRHITELMYPQLAEPSPSAHYDENIKNTPEKKSDEELNPARRRAIGPENDKIINPDPSVFESEPPRTMLMAVLVTLLCLPPTGFAAIYYSWLSGKRWRESASQQEPERLQTRRDAHDAARLARMWTGITLFLGMIAWSFILSRIPL